MVTKVLKRKEVELGFVHIPFKNRVELLGDLRPPFETKLNDLPAKIDRQGRLWCTGYLKNRFPINTEVTLIRNESGFQVIINMPKQEILAVPESVAINAATVCSSPLDTTDALNENSNDESAKHSKEIHADKVRLIRDSAFIQGENPLEYTRICNCSPNHINCLTAKEWMKAQVAVWEFFYEKRDFRDKDIHPAVFPIGLPRKCIELFTHRGELVLDPFVGSGTTLLAAQDTERNAVGFDLKEEYVKLSMSRLGQKKLDSQTQQIAICDDSHNIPQYLKEETIALSVTSPPYSNMLNRPRKNKSIRGNLRQNKHFNKVQQYSSDIRDLGTMEGTKYAEVIGEIYRGILPLMRKKGHCVINVTDLWWENKRIPIHLYIIENMHKVGYELRNTIIWDRRNLVNGVGIFGYPNNYITLGTTFEYILDFWRPP